MSDVVSHPASIATRNRVEYLDTDLTGHYHHSTVIRWVESAESTLLSHLGLDRLPTMPRVSYQANYHDRLWKFDIAYTHLEVVSVGNTSLQYAFAVKHNDVCAVDGQYVVVNVAPGTGKPRPWEPHQRKALLHSGPQLSELDESALPGNGGPVRVDFPDDVRPRIDDWGIGYG